MWEADSDDIQKGIHLVILSKKMLVCTLLSTPAEYTRTLYPAADLGGPSCFSQGFPHAAGSPPVTSEDGKNAQGAGDFRLPLGAIGAFRA